jgi:transcriptional regulator with XRE-family HTH domain
VIINYNHKLNIGIYMPARNNPISDVSLTMVHAGWRDIADPVIGLRICELREQAGANVGDVARPLGLRIKALKAIESGEESADSALLHCLGGIFRVPVAFFFEGLPAVSDGAAKPGSEAQSGRAPRARELVKILNICEPAGRTTAQNSYGANRVSGSGKTLTHKIMPGDRRRHMAPAGFCVYNTRHGL